MKTTYTEDSWSIGRAVNNIRSTPDTGDGSYDEGEVMTEHGYVNVYAQGDARFKPITNLRFGFRGRCHSRIWSKRFTPRACVTKAVEFANDIVKKYSRAKGKGI